MMETYWVSSGNYSGPSLLPCGLCCRVLGRARLLHVLEIPAHAHSDDYYRLHRNYTDLAGCRAILACRGALGICSLSR